MCPMAYLKISYTSTRVEYGLRHLVITKWSPFKYFIMPREVFRGLVLQLFFSLSLGIANYLSNVDYRCDSIDRYFRI